MSHALYSIYEREYSVVFVVRLNGGAFLRHARFHCSELVYLVFGKTAVAAVLLENIIAEASYQSSDAWQVLGDILEELALNIKPTGRDSVFANAWDMSEMSKILYAQCTAVHAYLQR